MALVKCPDCGKCLSDKAVSCPKCGCPNDGTFTVVEKGKHKQKIWNCVVFAVAIAVVIIVLALILKPVESNSPFYDMDDLNHEEVIGRHGEPDDVFELSNYYEYTYNKVRFMGFAGEMVYRFDNDGSFAGDLIFAQWILDGADYSEKKIEKVCSFYDELYGKRTVREDGGYEWNNPIENERIWLRMPDYPGGLYEFEYRPW